MNARISNIVPNGRKIFIKHFFAKRCVHQTKNGCLVELLNILSSVSSHMCHFSYCIFRRNMCFYVPHLFLCRKIFCFVA